MSEAVERIEGLFRTVDTRDQRLVVVNRTAVESTQRLLEQTFEGQTVDIEERTASGLGENVVLLLREGSVVAASAFEELMDTCLLVNSDLYRTGTSGIDRAEAPDVIASLEETVFDLRGFPASNNEKLL